MAGLDIEALKRKMQEVKDKQSGGGRADFWKPKDGRNVIRILPAAEGKEFYSEAKVRYNVGPDSKMVTIPLDSSPANCPIHEYVDKLWKTKDPDDEKLAKRMKASNRYYFNIIDRSIEEGQEGYGEVLAYGCGSTIFTDILGIIVDPDYGDITDPEEGYDIIITKSGKKLDTEYKTNARPKQTPIGIPDWKEKLNDLEKLATPRDYAKRLAILTGDNTSDDDSSDDSKGTVGTSSEPKDEEKKAEKKPVDEKPVSSESTGGKSEDEIEAEIAAMLND